MQYSTCSFVSSGFLRQRARRCFMEGLALHSSRLLDNQNVMEVRCTPCTWDFRTRKLFRLSIISLEIRSFLPTWTMTIFMHYVFFKGNIARGISLMIFTSSEFLLRLEEKWFKHQAMVIISRLLCSLQPTMKGRTTHGDSTLSLSTSRRHCSFSAACDSDSVFCWPCRQDATALENVPPICHYSVRLSTAECFSIDKPLKGCSAVNWWKGTE